MENWPLLFVFNGLQEVNGVLWAFLRIPVQSKQISDVIMASATSGCTGKDTDRFCIPPLVMLWCGQVD